MRQVQSIGSTDNLLTWKLIVDNFPATNRF